MTFSSDEFFSLTGSHFYHYGSCKTRLWLYHNNIEVGKDNDHIKIGKHLDSTSHVRNRKSLTIQGICQIDYVDNSGIMEVHEIKKGRKISDAIELQVLFYMYVIEKLTGELPKGYVHFPEVNKISEVIFNEHRFMAAVEDIKKVLSGSCPKPKKIPICSGCAYAEMCWA